MAVTEADTLAAASICRAMAEYQQVAGLVVGITTALSEPTVAGEILRMTEELMASHGDLDEYRALRDTSAANLAEMRAILND